MVVESRNLVGLFTCIFLREQHVRSGAIRFNHSYTVMTGLGGTYGNKGAVISRFLFDHTSFCFINAHLAAHQDKVGKRNVDAITILRAPGQPLFSSTGSTPTDIDATKLGRHCFVRGGDGTQVLDFELCFFSGDLNYRIDMNRQKVIDCISNGDLEFLRSCDQLLRQRTNPSSAAGQMNLVNVFEEGLLNFAPTYKYDRGSDIYDSSEKKRTPAWCDR